MKDREERIFEGTQQVVNVFLLCHVVHHSLMNLMHGDEWNARQESSREVPLERGTGVFGLYLFRDNMTTIYALSA